MLLRLGCPVNDVIPFLEAGYEARNLFRRILQVVVHRHDDVVFRQPDAAEQGVVLAVIPHEVDTLNAGEALRQRGNHIPASIAASVVDENHLEWIAGSGEHGMEPFHQEGQGLFAVVYWNDDGNRSSEAGILHGFSASHH